jgi:hypothetical protein
MCWSVHACRRASQTTQFEMREWALASVSCSTAFAFVWCVTHLHCILFFDWQEVIHLPGAEFNHPFALDAWGAAPRGGMLSILVSIGLMEMVSNRYFHFTPARGMHKKNKKSSPDPDWCTCMNQLLSCVSAVPVWFERVSTWTREQRVESRRH